MSNGTSPLLVAVLFLALAVIGWLIYRNPQMFKDLIGADSFVSGEHIVVNGTWVGVEIADTDELRIKGLSGRENLAQRKGMLFVFDQDGYHRIWMKDMRFEIDIIWIAADGTIVDIEKSVGPETYPESFYPSKEARYVLEVVGGFSDVHNVNVGDRVAI